MTLSLKSLTSRLSEWLQFRKEPIETSTLEARLVKLELEVAQMKCDRSQVSENSLPRVPGQDRGQVWIADDFNAPLPETILNDFLNPLYWKAHTPRACRDLHSITNYCKSIHNSSR